MAIDTQNGFAPKKKRGKKKAAAPSPAIAQEEEQETIGINPDDLLDPDAQTIIIDDTMGGDPQVIPGFQDPMQHVSVEVNEDGTVDIDFDPPGPDTGPTKHDDNLAEKLPESVLHTICSQLMDDVGEDIKDRGDWVTQRADGIDQLGIKVERPKGSIGASSAPVEGMSVVRDPLLIDAVCRFQATAFGELCPAAGPVKCVNYGDGDTANDTLAQQLEDDMNYYLSSGARGTAREYYPDTRNMLFWTGFASGMFKKVYKCPLRRRPVSESVDGADLILPSNASSLQAAGRITHQVAMKRSDMRRMQILGVYRDVPLTRVPTPDPNALDRKKTEVQGMRATPSAEDSQDYTVYEVYCELDIPGFEHKEGNEETGLPLPYRVTIDKDSETILEIRRNWREDDEDFQAKIPFVAFPYVTGFGVYGIGLLHLLGNMTMALTAMLREAIDASMFANFPGFLVAKSGTRQLQGDFRVAPGSGAAIDVGTKDIRQAVMPLPYKDVSPSHVALMQQVREVGTRLGGTADTPVGEGKQDAPVGTTLAMIEQATKIESSVHKALHSAQAEEFCLLKELFQEDPEALWRGNKRPKLGNTQEKRLANFKLALDNCELVPMADPNTPSHMHRVMKALAIKQLQAANPPMYDPMAVDRRILAMIHVDNPEELFAPQQAGAQGPNPEQVAAMGQFQLKAADIGIKEKKLQLDMAKMISDARNAEAERKSKETIETMKIAQSLAVHPESNPIVDTQLLQMQPFLHAQPGGGQPPAGPPAGGPAPAARPGQPPMATGGEVPPTPAVPEAPDEPEWAQLVRTAQDLALRQQDMGYESQQRERQRQIAAAMNGSLANRGTFNPRWWN